jgi:hypothetical protein
MQNNNLRSRVRVKVLFGSVGSMVSPHNPEFQGSSPSFVTSVGPTPLSPRRYQKWRRSCAAVVMVGRDGSFLVREILAGSITVNGFFEVRVACVARLAPIHQCSASEVPAWAPSRGPTTESLNANLCRKLYVPGGPSQNHHQVASTSDGPAMVSRQPPLNRSELANGPAW